jgi:hypothetical protein
MRSYVQAIYQEQKHKKFHAQKDSNPTFTGVQILAEFHQWDPGFTGW